MYQNDNFGGWEKVVGETSQLDITGSEQDAISSVRVRPSCTLKLFENYNNDVLLDTLTDDVSLLSNGVNDEASSLSCACTGMRDKLIINNNVLL